MYLKCSFLSNPLTSIKSLERQWIKKENLESGFRIALKISNEKSGYKKRNIEITISNIFV